MPFACSINLAYSLFATTASADFAGRYSVAVVLAGSVTLNSKRPSFSVHWLSINPYVYYSPDYLRTGANATYAGGIVKFTLPSAWFPTDWGVYLSGEAAHYWIGTFTAFGTPFDLPDYTTWNVGIGATYKVFTVDLRYYDTDLSKTNCELLTGDPSGFSSGTSKWCSATVIGKVSFDLTLNSNIK